RLVADGPAGLGVEEVHALGVHDHLDLVADLDPGAGGEGGHELGPLDLVGGDVVGVGVLVQQLGVGGDHLGGVDVEVDHDLGPQGLDQRHRRLEAGGGGGGAGGGGGLPRLASRH